MLTARQMVSIATRNSTPPLKLSGLSQMYTMKPLSLRTVANLMDQQKSYLLCEVRDISTLKTVKSFAELQAALAKPSPPSKATLIQLSAILSAAGGSIKYVSKDWLRVGIAGNVGALAGVHAFRLDMIAGFTSSKDVTPATSTELHPLDLTPGQWAALGGALAATGGVLILVTGGAGAVPLAIVACLAGTATVSQALAGIGVVLTVGGAIAVDTGAYQTIVNNPATPVVVSQPSGIVNLPINPADAGTAVITDASTGDVSGVTTAPTVDTNNLTSPSDTDPGDPSAGDPGSSGKEVGKDDKDGKDSAKDDKDGKDGEKDDKDGKDGKDGEKDDKDGKDSEKDDKDDKDGEKDDKDSTDGDGGSDLKPRAQGVGLMVSASNPPSVSRKSSLWDRFSV